MSNHITVIGNLTDVPVVREISGGRRVCGFTVADNNRKKVDGEWVDGDTTFWDCTTWNEPTMDNLSEHATKGTRVIVTGKAKSRRYETSTGEKRTVMEIDVEEVGLSLRRMQETFGRTAVVDDVPF